MRWLLHLPIFFRQSHGTKAMALQSASYKFTPWRPAADFVWAHTAYYFADKPLGLLHDREHTKNTGLGLFSPNFSPLPMGKIVR